MESTPKTGTTSTARELVLSECALLKDDMNTIANAIADECGQNVPYVASINLSEFPSVIELIEDAEQDEKEKENILSTCRFLAENGNKFPVGMKDASYEEFRAYALEHAEEILREIREDIEYDYEDATGRPFRESAADEDARTLRENEDTALLTLRLLDKHGVTFSVGKYDGSRDTLSVTGVAKDLIGLSPGGVQITDALIHLCCDQGYYTIHYKSERGPFTAAGMFDGAKQKVTPEDVENFPYNLLYERQPDFLTKILAACDEAGRVPTYIEVSTTAAKVPEPDCGSPDGGGSENQPGKSHFSKPIKHTIF